MSTVVLELAFSSRPVVGLSVLVSVGTVVGFLEEMDPDV